MKLTLQPFDDICHTFNQNKKDRKCQSEENGGTARMLWKAINSKYKL